MTEHHTRTGSPAVLDVLRLRRASAYGAGSGLDEALEVCRRLAGYGIATAIGYSASANEPPRAVADVHLAAFDRLSAEGLDSYVSIKLLPLGFDAVLFAELAAAAASSARRLHIDALEPKTADPTWALIDGVPRTTPLGMTLPGRWHRSPDDAVRALKMGLSLRVVKGHWADGTGVRLDPAAGFLDIVDRLCGYDGRVGIATHDQRLLRESLRRLTASGTACESELFLGMPFRGPASIARTFGVPVRLYVPYGDAWPGYGIADLVRHPRTVWWLAQDLVLGRDKTWRSIQRPRSR